MNKIGLLEGREYNLKTVQIVSRPLNSSVLKAVTGNSWNAMKACRRIPNTNWQDPGSLPGGGGTQVSPANKFEAGKTEQQKSFQVEGKIATKARNHEGT